MSNSLFLAGVATFTTIVAITACLALVAVRDTNKGQVRMLICADQGADRVCRRVAIRELGTRA